MMQNYFPKSHPGDISTQKQFTKNFYFKKSCSGEKDSNVDSNEKNFKNLLWYKILIFSLLEIGGRKLFESEFTER